jgi:hypothetical protein
MRKELQSSGMPCSVLDGTPERLLRLFLALGKTVLPSGPGPAAGPDMANPVKEET